MDAQSEVSRDFRPFEAIVSGCSFTHYAGAPPGFSKYSLDELLLLARTAAGLVEWPDEGALQVQGAVSRNPPNAKGRAWIESQMADVEASKKATLEGLKEQQLDTWAEALKAELVSRQKKAARPDAEAIDQAIAQVGFVLEHKPGSALRSAPEWDETQLQQRPRRQSPFMVIVDSCGPEALRTGTPFEFEKQPLDSLLRFAAAAGAFAKRPSEGLPDRADEPASFAAWSKAFHAKLDTDHAAFARSLRETSRLEEWAAALRTELSRRQRQASDTEAIEQACAEIDSLREYLRA